MFNSAVLIAGKVVEGKERGLEETRGGEPPPRGVIDPVNFPVPCLKSTLLKVYCQPVPGRGATTPLPHPPVSVIFIRVIQVIILTNWGTQVLHIALSPDVH